MKPLARSLSTVALTLASVVLHGQYSIIPGEYSYSHQIYSTHKLVLLVAKPSGKNWTVKGFHQVDDKTYPLSGTLYASGKLALKPNQVNPKDKTLGFYRYEDGRFDPTTGAIKFDVFYGGEKLEQRGVLLFSARCVNRNNKAEMETVWVLQEGFPKYDDVYEKGSKPFTVDPSGTMTYPATSLKDGKPIPQTLKFSPPKEEYRYGEELEVFVDASGTEKGAYPYVMVYMYFAWAPGGWIGIGNDKGHYAESVGWRPTGKIKFEPRDESQAGILVGAPGFGGLVWRYKKVERPKKPATTGGTTSVGGPGTTHPSSVQFGTINGDVTVRMPDKTDWTPATQNMTLMPRSVISVAPDASATLRLPNGATVDLKPGTELRVEELTPSGGMARVVVRAMAGELIYRLRGQEPRVISDFVVRAFECVTSTRGTEFSIKVNPQERLVVINLREGKLSFDPGHGMEKMELTAPTTLTWRAVGSR